MYANRCDVAAKQNHQDTIDRWLECDLTAAAAEGNLAPAFEIDDVVDRIAEMIDAGRHPILTGESGVGKTAAIHELVRRAHAGGGPQALRGKRVLQFSIQRIAAGLAKPDSVRPEVQKLFEALVQGSDTIVPYIRDIHYAYDFDLEPQLQSLALRLRSPILAEGTQSVVESIFEQQSGMEQHFYMLNLEEPSVEKTERILAAWNAECARRNNRSFSPDAIHQALHLTYRFLARSHLPSKAIELLKQAAVIGGSADEIAVADVIERFSQNYRVPRSLVDPEMPLSLEDLEARFRKKVLSQQEAIDAVVNLIGLIKAGLSDMRRPFGVFLFVGPTGVGKTHIAQLLAEFLFGSRDHMIRLNMADYQGEDAPAVLFGNPDGHNLGMIRGVLTQRVLGHPFAVLLLDEFEKAHTKVHDRFLQLFDEGAFINGRGELIVCRSMIIIATSNAGAELYRGQTLGFSGRANARELDRDVDRILERHFRFEFLNRFDQVVHFRPLSREDIRTIARRELEQLQTRPGLKHKGLSLEVDESVIDWLAVNGFEPDYGARFLRRTIERHVTTALADTIVRQTPSAGARIALTVRRNRIVARIIEEVAGAVPRTQSVALPLGTTERVRTFDRTSLAREISDVLQSAGARLAALADKQAERSALLESMNEPGFWDSGELRVRVLERFRELDVAIRVESRLAKSIVRLKDMQDDEDADLTALARRLELAAESLREWNDRSAEEGVGAAWMVISNADPLRPAGQWVHDLTQMERRWCRRLNLAVTVVAYELHDDELVRVVLDIEGPGTAVYLGMEEGTHRLHRQKKYDLRALIEIVPKGPVVREPRAGLRENKHRNGLFDMDAAYHGRLEVEARGLTMEFVGSHSETLSHLLTDLQLTWTEAASSLPPVARHYAEDGVGARDPRSGATMLRFKDVMRGKLDKFLESWRRRVDEEHAHVTR